MADVGDIFGYKDPALDDRLDNDDNEEEEADRTRPFWLNAASTPHHGGMH